MRVGVRALTWAWIIAAGVCLQPAARAQTASPHSPHEVYQALNDLRVDPTRIYHVREVRVQRDAVTITLANGTIGFFSAYDGRITGAVFTGKGHALCIPRDVAERQSLAHFVGVPLLDQSFSRAYLRFTDDTANELLKQIDADGGVASPDDDFAHSWGETVGNLNPTQSVRILEDFVSDAHTPYFYADVLSDQTGAFDILVDNRRSEQILIGQTRWVSGEPFYDVWASFPRSDASPAPPEAFLPVSYSIATTIEADRTLEGATTIELRAASGGERGVPLELSRFLTVQSIQDSEGHALDFFQNEALSRNQVAERGNDTVLVFLPETPRAGQMFRLRLTYRGGVISDAGNGVYFVGDRGSWYPHISGMNHFVPFETAFRWPRKLHLVATGEKLDEKEDGDWRTGHWRSDGDSPVAGFNLGEYVMQTADSVDGVQIELCANAHLETSLAERLGPEHLRFPTPLGPQSAIPQMSGRIDDHVPVSMPPSPAAMLHQVGSQIAAAMRYEIGWLGPFPFHRLEVSQIPGSFGQGWPGLLYLPTFSFLPTEVQQRAGLSAHYQQGYNEIVPYHEVAHQWWGNEVGWTSYRDQWINEGLANYIAVMGADSARPGEHLMTKWLERYRDDLVAHAPDQDSPADEAGPLVHGFRLNSSRDPGAYEKVVYGKGTWVFHMLRMMLYDPNSKKPDERFMALLRGLIAKYGRGSLTNDGLKEAVEQAMTPAMEIEGGRSMGWFFDQFVRETGIPSYTVEFTARQTPKGFVIRGKLKQADVPGDFMLRVPIYAQLGGRKPELLGYVVTSGPETSFQFVSASRPRRLLVDPQMTLLCITPSPSQKTVPSEAQSSEEHAQPHRP